jgi:hypothetical protein
MAGIFENSVFQAVPRRIQKSRALGFLKAGLHVKWMKKQYITRTAE